MHRSLVLTALATVLVVGLATAAPTVEVRYYGGIPQIYLSGEYPLSTYTVYRADAPEGPWVAFTDNGVLCLGPCFAEDLDARPGATYWYRFDLRLADGTFASYGPYQVTIAGDPTLRLAVRVVPNPSRAASRVEIYLAGAASDPRLEATAVLFDLQGRALRTVFRGSLPRGLNTVAWDGRADDGRVIGAGQYFLRIKTPLGISTTRVLRVN